MKILKVLNREKQEEYVTIFSMIRCHGITLHYTVIPSCLWFWALDSEHISFLDLSTWAVFSDNPTIRSHVCHNLLPFIVVKHHQRLFFLSLRFLALWKLRNQPVRAAAMLHHLRLQMLLEHRQVASPLWCGHEHWRQRDDLPVRHTQLSKLWEFKQDVEKKVLNNNEQMQRQRQQQQQ